MPSLRTPLGHGYGAAYCLGLFSGIVSACCAPVLAGVVVLTGSVASFGAALAVSLTYVAGMIAPLTVLALVWERRGWGSPRLHGRRVRLGFGRWARTMLLGTAASGVVLMGMGIVTLVTAVTGPPMPSSGWRVSVAAWLGHLSSVTARALSWLPGWAVLLGLAASAAALVFQARHRRLRAADKARQTEAADGPGPPGAGMPETTTASAGSGQEGITHER